MDIDGPNEYRAPEEVDVLIAPAAPPQPDRRWLKAGVGVVAAGALIFGGLALNDSRSELDTTVADEVPDDTGDADGADSEAPATSSETDDDGSASDEALEEEGYVAEFESEAAMDIAFGGSDSGLATFDGERFVSLATVDGQTWLLRTSVDGLDWTDTPTQGLPTQSHIWNLRHHEGTLVATIEQYDGRGVSQHVASSTDGISWTTAQLGATDSNAESHLSGTAVLNGELVVLRTIYEGGSDPEQMLIEAGLLPRKEGVHLCDVMFDSAPDPISVYVCDYSDFEEEYNEPDPEVLADLEARWDAATSDEERAAVEAELEALWRSNEPEPTLAATISPGDALYDDLAAAFGGLGLDGSGVRTEVLSGPFAGPFEIVGELPSSGFVSNVVEASDALFAHVEVYDEERGEQQSSTILTSTDGSTWTAAGAAPGTGGYLEAAGDALMFTAYDEFGSSTFVSTDGSTTWEPSPLTTSLFHSHTRYISGDAGIVAFTSGQVEEYYSPSSRNVPQENPTLEVDGYTLTLPMFGGSMVLTGPDGEVIHELNEEEIYDGSSNAVRSNPISGSMSFLDPDTGEDLVTFTEESMQAIYESMYPEEEMHQAPEMGFEINFSVDGRTWESVSTEALPVFDYNSSLDPVAVGDDELILASMTYIEPPLELFAFESEGRNPTEAEIEALNEWEQQEVKPTYYRIELP